jgi:hypothetical protein
MSDPSIAMPTSPTWIVCEKTGKWAASIRVAIARQSTKRGRPIAIPRIQEVRALAEFEAAVQTLDAVGLLEVRADNLAAVLELLANAWRRNVRIVALLDCEMQTPSSYSHARPPSSRGSTDVVAEAGALAVIDSPRQISTAIQVIERYWAARSKVVSLSGERESIVDRAWAALPWQDA